MSPKAILTRFEAMSVRVYLVVNALLACLVALAHGGALLVSLSKPTPHAEEIRQLSMISLPLATLVLASALTAFIRPGLTLGVLRMHGVIIAVSATALLLWAISILVGELPSERFIWTTGLLSAWVVYSVFVLTRHTLPQTTRMNHMIYYSPFLALVFVLPVDIGVALRLVSSNG